MNTEKTGVEAVRIAQAILNREVELVSACRAIQRPLAVLGLRMDEDFTIFVGVDSEADEFAFGEERRHWNPSALQTLDRKLEAFDTHYRPQVEDACRKVVTRLG